MRTLFISCILFLVLAACSQTTTTSNRQIHNVDFNWTIAIPNDFDTLSAAQTAKLQNKGSQAIEKATDQKIENHAKTIFAFKNEQFNYFEANYQPFDTATDGNYLESCHAVSQLLYNTFASQMPDAVLDSSSTTTTISGLVFQTFKMTIVFPNKLVMKFYMFSRLFGKKEFTINITAVDRQKEKLLLDAWTNSKFE